MSNHKSSGRFIWQFQSVSVEIELNFIERIEVRVNFILMAIVWQKVDTVF